MSVVDDDGEVADREVKVGVMNRVPLKFSPASPGENVVIGTKAPAAAARAQTGSALAPAAKGGGRP